MPEYTTSVEIAAPPAEVFTYLTTAAGMRQWMGTHAELDPQPGGRFAVDIAGHAIRGHYLEVDPPDRVVISWGMAGSADLPAGASTVTFELTALDGGTHLELTHSDLPEVGLPGHADGWEHFTGRLAQAARGNPPGLDHWRPIPEREQ